MTDRKTARDEPPKYELHPADLFEARCVDMVDLGFNVETFQDQPPELKDKVALIFRTAHRREDGTPGELGIEFTCSFGKKSNLRKFAESWRGKPYTDEEARAGVPLEKFAGVPALLTVVHKTSAKQNTYAAIGGISKVPAAMLATVPSADGYQRSEFWTRKKAEYAAAVEAFKARSSAQAPPATEDGYPLPPDEDDDLPF